jgi:hypothetical protein
MVSGSTGIIGAVDSIYVLEKAKRIENAAVLHVTGRDIEDMQIKLEFDRDPPVWRFIGYGDKGQKGTDPIIPAITDFMTDKSEYKATATELYSALYPNSDGKADSKENGITANNLSRKLKEHQLTLEKSHSIKVSFDRKNSARLILLCKVTSDDDFTGVLPSPTAEGLDEVVSDDSVITDSLPVTSDTDFTVVVPSQADDAPPWDSGDALPPIRDSKPKRGVSRKKPSPVTNNSKSP